MDPVSRWLVSFSSAKHRIAKYSRKSGAPAEEPTRIFIDVQTKDNTYLQDF
jgi:hypothetical protein